MAAIKETILTKSQIDFLEFAGGYQFISEYYLTGGTALAAFYLHHRYSEDLDFFIEREEVNIASVRRLIKDARKKFGLEKITYKNFQGLHSFFLNYPNGSELKVDFSYYPFQRIEKGLKKFGVSVDSLLDIAVNKLQTIAMRTSARDFVDVYFIMKKIDGAITDLIKVARNKFDWHIEPIQYGKQFMKVSELKDFPRMIKALDKKDMEEFFLSEARKFKKEIFL